ncbi:hypothetical protein BV22DRAFT_530194 [Leucogyrophana mollusca]|uniref:Uncharacterized protein n=1 Tax=Leucogyrophana mollusca TaxID=85980 RepID=A0ACB8BHY4_9AGAM|nr:hypothetical protein BV22DRAFT_530194 [Leucogyrophana mollusca]
MSVLYDPADVAVGQNLQVLNYLLVSFVTLLAFDYIINLEHEVAYLFNAKLSISKCIYLVCRYVPLVLSGVQWPLSLASNIDMNACSTLFQITTWLTLIILSCVECIFLLRTYALWSCSKRVLIVLLSSLAAAVIPVITVLAVYQSSIFDLFSQPPIPFISSCYQQGLEYAFFVCYLLLLVFETEIFLFTIYRVHVHCRHARGSLLKILAKHGVLYFVFSLLFSVTNILVIFLLPSYYSSVFGVLQTLAQALLATRMQLSLWKADQGRATAVSVLTSRLEFVELLPPTVGIGDP